MQLPTGIVIDMTTWSATIPERSRLPVDPLTGYVDIMIAPNGQVVVYTPQGFRPPIGLEYYHFWLADVDDVFEPGTGTPKLPVPEDTPGYTGTDFLKRDRRLVSLNTQTGQITTTHIDSFDLTDPLPLEVPYRQAQAGVKDRP